MNRFKSDNGYTFIELFITLNIIVMLSAVAIASFKPMIDKLENERFLTQLLDDIYFAQQLAIATNEQTQLLFQPHRYEYRLYQGTTLRYSRSYKKHINVEGGTLQINELRFLSNGNPYKSGTIFIYMNDKLHALRILLGKGRFYVETAS